MCLLLLSLLFFRGQVSGIGNLSKPSGADEGHVLRVLGAGWPHQHCLGYEYISAFSVHIGLRSGTKIGDLDRKGTVGKAGRHTMGKPEISAF
jgi:hypothetical protein